MAELSETKFADYVYWLDKKTWSKDQAAFLFSRLDPDTFSEWSQYASTREWNQYERYRSMSRLISAGIKSKELKPKARTPEDWINWAVLKKLKVDQLLVDAVNAKWPQRGQASIEKSTNGPVSTKERATLLVIIAALSKLANVDISKPSKAASVIEATTEQLGARVAQRTIEEHLKAVPDALQRRSA